MDPGLWPVQILILCAFISTDIFNVTLKDFKSGNWTERPESFMRVGVPFAAWMTTGSDMQNPLSSNEKRK